MAKYPKTSDELALYGQVWEEYRNAFFGIDLWPTHDHAEPWEAVATILFTEDDPDGPVWTIEKQGASPTKAVKRVLKALLADIAQQQQEASQDMAPPDFKDVFADHLAKHLRNAKPMEMTATQWLDYLGHALPLIVTGDRAWPSTGIGFRYLLDSVRPSLGAHNIGIHFRRAPGHNRDRLIWMKGFAPHPSGTSPVPPPSSS